jgi:hypothetical protein
MPTYYKYVERNAESQVNWAEVGKDITTMLDDETKIREEKKAAIQKAFQDDMEELANAPQGKWQDGNDTVNNFAHDMMEQQLIDNKLLKSGKMKPRDYTLRRENYKSQTNVLFDLQKTLQSERENTIDLYQKGKIQALNISNQADVEAYKNFKDRKAIINPLSANISMGLYEDQVVDGKTVRVLKNSTPVNVLMGQIVQKVPTLQIEDIMNKWVPTVGKQKDYIYQIATNSKAGSIVELMGVGALDNLEKEHPELKDKLGDYKKVIDDFNLSLTQQVKAWLPSPYQVASILTENLGGKYNADSYVWDENIAKADKTKILKKVDPLTGMVTLDENAPHYKEQKQEAEDWIRTSLLNKLDQGRSLTVTGTTPYAPQPREESEYKVRTREENKEKISVAGSWNDIYTAKTVAEKNAAVGTILGSPVAKKEGLIGITFDEKGTAFLKYDNPKLDRFIKMLDENQKPISLKQWSILGDEIHNITDEKLLSKARGGSFGGLEATEWKKVEAKRQGGKAEAPVVEILPELFRIKSKESSKSLQKKLGPTFKVTDKSLGGLFGNDVEVIAPNGEPFTYNAASSQSEAAVAKADLEQFIKDNGAPVSGAATTTGGVVR